MRQMQHTAGARDPQQGLCDARHLEQEQDRVQLAGLRSGVQRRRAAVRGCRRVCARRQQLLYDLAAACAAPRTPSRVYLAPCPNRQSDIILRPACLAMSWAHIFET